MPPTRPPPVSSPPHFLCTRWGGTRPPWLPPEAGCRAAAFVGSAGGVWGWRESPPRSVGGAPPYVAPAWTLPAAGPPLSNNTASGVDAAASAATRRQRVAPVPAASASRTAGLGLPLVLPRGGAQAPPVMPRRGRPGRVRRTGARLHDGRAGTVPTARGRGLQKGASMVALRRWSSCSSDPRPQLPTQPPPLRAPKPPSPPSRVVHEEPLTPPVYLGAPTVVSLTPFSPRDGSV